MSDTLTTDLTQQLENRHLPRFLKPPDENFYCVRCGELLYHPIQQIVCGHRICGSCLTVIKQEDTQLSCPGNDEDCVLVDLTQPEHVTRDFVATRLLAELDVYCSFYDRGCPEILKWCQLDKHTGSCPYGIVVDVNNENLMKINVSVIKNAIRREYDTLSRHLKVQVILPSLCTSEVFNTEESRYIIECAAGPNNKIQSKIILDKLLLYKDEEKTNMFLYVLKKQQYALYDVIEETVGRITAGDSSVAIEPISEIRRILREAYGTSHRLMMSHNDVHIDMLPLCFTSKNAKTGLCKSDEFSNSSPIWNINSLFEETKSRLIICSGVAGTGKSTLVQRVVQNWCKLSYEPSCNVFDFMVALPMCHVNTKVPLILGFAQAISGKRDPESCILDYLKHALIPKEKVLIIIDGIDECEIPASSDVHKLIMGDIYPHIKVMITCRPYEPLLLSNALEDSTHICLQGITQSQFVKNIQLNLKKQLIPEVETLPLIEECCRVFSEYDWLQIPVYLNFFIEMVKAHFKEEFSLKNIQLPKSSAEFFKQFLYSSLLKLNRFEQTDKTVLQYNHEGNLLKKGNGVSLQMKTFIYMLGKCCLDLCKQRFYSFTKEDLEEYFIDIDDLLECSFLSDSYKQGESRYCFRHKLLQEYLAATYLTNMKWEDKELSQIISASEVTQQWVKMVHRYGEIMNFAFDLSAQISVDKINQMDVKDDISRSIGEMWMIQVGDELCKIADDFDRSSFPKQFYCSDELKGLLSNKTIQQHNTFIPLHNCQLSAATFERIIKTIMEQKNVTMNVITWNKFLLMNIYEHKNGCTLDEYPERMTKSSV